SVYCTPGFVAPRFFDWTDESRATWYTAVPTMHQAILDRAPDHADIIARSQLRFARSSSASLAPQVMARLEATLGVPVIEAYGMTEAAHQMTSNPLPPDARKPGSVGPQAGPDVAVMSNDGSFVAAGQEGEIVIRGSNVMDGYAAAAHVNEAAFHGGWFRTGDLGRLDEDGYLTISGRIKEIINRGGETISPREIDEALLEHPGVAQALTFAVPDERLGEQVAAAVVPAAGSRASETDLRRHVSNRLATAKVPRRIVFLDDIPKGPTGKLQRIGLATRLGLENLDGVVDAAVAHTAPRTAAETLLAGLWTEVLGLAEPSVHDRFLDVGGDSVLATRLIARVDAALGFTLDMIEFFDRPTIAEQAALIEDMLLEAESRHGR
ncbi:MAG: AMP-binding protein, partial [Acidimicrobiia bacterium]